MSRTRKPAEIRKEEIIAITLRLCQINGIKSVTRKQIAEAAGVAEGLVSHHFSSMKQLQRDIVRHAVKNRDIRVVAQCVAAGYLKKSEVPYEIEEHVLTILNNVSLH